MGSENVAAAKRFVAAAQLAASAGALLAQAIDLIDEDTVLNRLPKAGATLSKIRRSVDAFERIWAPPHNARKIVAEPAPDLSIRAVE